jgi:predicted HTH domain antitoxin
MGEAIGIRLDDDFMSKIEKLSKEDVADRSTTIRKLIYEGYKSLMKKRAAEEYRKGKITISEAAKKAELNIPEMEQYLVDSGYKSEYSVEDLRREMKIFEKR